MEYKLYSGSDILLNDSSSSSSKESWNLPNCVMDKEEEYFTWTHLKIDEEEFQGENKLGTRKRKASIELKDEQKVKQGNYKIMKDPLSLEEKADGAKKIVHAVKDTTRIPQWEVEDYEEIHPEIEGSLQLASELTPNTYVSDSVLSINGMTVFKQEIPSPTMNEVAQLQIARQQRQSPTSTQQNGMMTPINSTIEENSQNIFNNTINQLLSQSSLTNIHNVIDNNNLSTSPHFQDNYGVSSTNFTLNEDSRFQYVLAAATSIATKQNEDSLTYLNQGQSYEIKLKKLGDLSMYRGKLLKSVIRICFHERRLQYMEKEQMESWQKARPGDRILEADIPLSYGAFDITQPPNGFNVISFVWDPTKEVGVYIKVNCISTEFTPKKHGGEKGVPFRIQVETYQNEDNLISSKRLHAAACQIKVFKLKGADRKHKQDKEKIMKRPIAEQEKYQPSCDCTVLNDIPPDAVLQSPPLPSYSSSYTPSKSGPERSHVSNSQNDNFNQPIVAPPKVALIVTPPSPQENKKESANVDGNPEQSSNNNQITQYTKPEDTVSWLTANRFEKYSDTFSRFSGSDMLRLSRDDLIDICGQADGIRLHNALHLKAIAPKLKIYVCQENSSVFNAIFLSSHSNVELLQKLCSMVTITSDQVKAIYIEGPHSIHIQLSDDVLRHVEEETMFSLSLIQDKANYILLLKRKIHK
ncbi:hypothetical protein GWI33_008196 [Rhynchophorus ferrugineus]|uniref:Grh/CP2 DB domain-containing protein n=1 Tax=Rhynchophorus ferrugineus TaxID=354439 RepID=A0A834ID79_RHYFE|nr:hypothetical protein GWI33_008196 [Rhynchophorus ferrugineus]